MKSVVIAICGDNFVGKTSLLESNANNFVLDEFNSERSNECSTPLEINEIQLYFDMWDSTEEIDFESVDIFLLCFSVTSRTSLENVKSTWYPQIQRRAPRAPIIIVGTKLDHRNNKVGDFVTRQEGDQLREALSAHRYFECSARTQEGIAPIFDTAIECVTANKPGWVLEDDVSRELYDEASTFRAPPEALATAQSARKFMDGLRALGVHVRALPSWALRNRDEQALYDEAHLLEAPPLWLTTSSHARQYLDLMRLQGYAIAAQPAWVVDRRTMRVYQRVHEMGAVPQRLGTLQAAEEFLQEVTRHDTRQDGCVVM